MIETGFMDWQGLVSRTPATEATAASHTALYMGAWGIFGNHILATFFG